MTDCPQDRPRHGQAHATADVQPSCILVVDADGPTLNLMDEWLAPGGYRVVDERFNHNTGPDGIALVVVDVPFPRQGGLALVERVAQEHAQVPILVLSSTFFASIECTGAVASALGVAGVLPKPITRDAVLGAVVRLARKPPSA